MLKATAEVNAQQPQAVLIESTFELVIKTDAKDNEMKKIISDKIQLTEASKASW